MSVSETERLVPAARVHENIEEPLLFERLIWPYRLALPLMNLIAFYIQIKKGTLRLFGTAPRINFFFVDGLSISARRVKENARGWRALEVVYLGGGVGANAFTRWIDWFWLHTRNAQAARNRLKMAKQGLRDAIFDIRARQGRSVRMLSLAAGSARGVMEVVAEMKRHRIRVEVTLIDLDPAAIRHAFEVARRLKIEDQVSGIVGDVRRFERLTGDLKPHIIEMMGLTDYLRNTLATMLFGKIYRHLQDNGYFFTSNVHPNSEAHSLKHAMNWDMIYRTPEELADLMVKGGFSAPSVVTEPHGIQSFAMAQK